MYAAAAFFVISLVGRGAIESSLRHGLETSGKQIIQYPQGIQDLAVKTGVNDAAIYDPQDTSVGGIHAFFLLRGDPRAYNLPPHPEVPTVYLKKGWTSSAVAAGLLLAGTFFAFVGKRP